MMSYFPKTFLVVILLLAALGGAAVFKDRQGVWLSQKAKVPSPRLVSGGMPLPPITAEAVLVKRMQSGEIIFEKNATALLPIASLTKMMTALIFGEEVRPFDLVEMSAPAKARGNADDKRSSIEIGAHLRAEDMLKLLVASSDNDAAYAVAEHAASNREPAHRTSPFPERVASFVRRMNERAEELELAGTHFANPAGSDDPDNYSTAADVARLAEFIERNHPELWAVSRLQETFVFDTAGRRYGIVNTNPLLQEFPAIYGSKTGFEDQARGAIVVLYWFATHELIEIIILKSANRFDDGRTIIHWLESNFVLASD